MFSVVIIIEYSRQITVLYIYIIYTYIHIYIYIIYIYIYICIYITFIRWKKTYSSDTKDFKGAPFLLDLKSFILTKKY